MTEIRVEITVFGQVQRVGYRNLVAMIASELGVAGFIKNDEKDEHKVLIACEGPEEKVKKFIEAIRIREFPVFVEKTEEKYGASKHEFKGFERILERDLAKATLERADEGALYMMLFSKEMKGLKEESKAIKEETKAMKNETTAIKEESKAIKEETRATKEETRATKEETKSLKEVTSDGIAKSYSNAVILAGEMKGFREDTGRSFSSMEKKYGAIHEEMLDFKKAMQEISAAFKEDRREMKELMKSLTNVLTKALVSKYGK